MLINNSRDSFPFIHLIRLRIPSVLSDLFSIIIPLSNHLFTRFFTMSEFDSRFIRRLVGTKVTTFLEFDALQQPSAVSSSASAASLSAAPLGASPPRISPLAASPSAVSLATDSAAAATLNTATSTTAPSISLSGSPPLEIGCSWIITKKLSENAVHLTQKDADMGCGPPMAVGKFLCYLEEDPTRIAFMRIYYQIPITGTEDADLATLAQQIQPPQVCGELEAFRLLMSQGCSSVPRFYGYCEKQQGEHDLVPGGFVKYVVWEKVPGEPLTAEFFWSLDLGTREDIRVHFRAAFEEMLRCGVKPDMSRISKIIYDQSTGNVRISGFRRGWPIRDKLEWSDTRYVEYRLAKPHDDRDWPSNPQKWKY
ncbi:hypothetical protein PMG11_07325 [Penicillium brasilianum]|uniref:Uncharacterized protein n=1 Tax=Penicillium brasilianum TaxID=104259 RepID=A0A0F7TS98_PENBI|nr:hypothetical protein PMG11_07325 [Penicillium brasilianum]